MLRTGVARQSEVSRSSFWMAVHGVRRRAGGRQRGRGLGLRSSSAVDFEEQQAVNTAVRPRWPLQQHGWSHWSVRRSSELHGCVHGCVAQHWGGLSAFRAAAFSPGSREHTRPVPCGRRSQSMRQIWTVLWHDGPERLGWLTKQCRARADVVMCCCGVGVW